MIVNNEKTCQEVRSNNLKIHERTEYKIKLHLQNVSTPLQVQQQIPQLQSSIPLQNNFVYIECNPNINAIQDVNKQFSNEITSLVATQPIQANALTYNLNPVGILEGLTDNGYAIQHLNVPATTLQYQTFSVPMQINQPNNIMQPITGKLNLLTNEVAVTTFRSKHFKPK